MTLMPKRIVDGEGIWRSDKLRRLPERLRPLYPWLLPLAMANGSFECAAEQVWGRCFAINLPSVTLSKTVELLNALESCGLLERWTAPDRKLWGYWTGIDRPGRLPPAARRGHEMAGMVPPSLGGEVIENTSEIESSVISDVRPTASERLANGYPMASQRLPSRARAEPEPKPKPKPNPKPDPKPEETQGEEYSLPDWLPQTEWFDFVAMRLNMRKPIKTPKQAEYCIRQLDALRCDGHDPGEVLAQSIAANWQGLFPVKNRSKNAGNSTLETNRRNAAEAAEILRRNAASAGGRG